MNHINKPTAFDIAISIAAAKNHFTPSHHKATTATHVKNTIAKSLTTLFLYQILNLYRLMFG